MAHVIHQHITGDSAVKIISSIESAIRDGRLVAGDRLPAVRGLADALDVSPATVASAYQSLQSRAILVSDRKRGTRVSHRPMITRRQTIQVPNAVNLSDGNPDPKLLPAFEGLISRRTMKPRLYGEEPVNTAFVQTMREEMVAEGVAVGECAVVNGTMDGLDRLFAERFRPGDRIAVEDPGFTGHHDLLASRGLSLLPVRIDDEGMLPDALHRACAEGANAVLITPRAQSPTGAAITADRARELRRVLKQRPEIFVIEDDHASFISDAPYHRMHDPAGKWAHFRSLSKSFNPDLRLAVMTGDDQTMHMMLDRLVVVERWVSQILQSLGAALLADRAARTLVKRATKTYAERREALVAALRDVGLQPVGHSGFNVWLPVSEETPTVQGLAAAGWAVAPGERFRIASPPGIRVTASRLEPRDARRFARAMRNVLFPSRITP